MEYSYENLQDFMNQQKERTARWEGIIKSDPRRAIRVLTSTGFATETIDGDTAWDASHIIENLKKLSDTPKSATWKSLVDAGLFVALCKCATTFRVAYMDGSAAQNITEEQKKAHSKELPSPWYEPLAIICTAALNCTIPPTKMEEKMIEDIKQNWSTVVQRIWSEPCNSLDKDSDASFERAIVAQIVLRLSTVDPSFLEVIFKPEDLTFAVCFRNWVHATAQEDIVLNNSMFLSLLRPKLTSPWKRYLATHPPPASKTILSRMMLGASKDSAAQKKRTPAQAADIVVTAFANHFSNTRLPLTAVRQEVELFDTFWEIAEKELPQFPRAVCKADRFWAALPPIVRRSIRAQKSEDRAIIIRVLKLYTAPMYYTNRAHAEFVDALIYGWVAGGLFDALDEAMDWIIEDVEGQMAVTLIMTTIDGTFPKLSTKTRAALRAQLPRTGAVWKIFKAGLAHGDNSSEGQYMRNHANFLSGDALNPQNPLWRQSASEMLALLGSKARGTSYCSRRGCEKPAEGPRCATGACKQTRYCSQACMKRDTEHLQMCERGWFSIVEQNMMITPSLEAKMTQVAAGGAQSS
ncbi:hypothetical protein C8Q73DRAFT_695316 [Cubamyces lactineus]|nr:hypothetical protein C8Q73DRAFT_695316 [Cubamyces lactineus]